MNFKKKKIKKRKNKEIFFHNNPPRNNQHASSLKKNILPIKTNLFDFFSQAQNHNFIVHVIGTFPYLYLGHPKP